MLAGMLLFLFVLCNAEKLGTKALRGNSGVQRARGTRFRGIQSGDQRGDSLAGAGL
jgi:hypothetical protein